MANEDKQPVLQGQYKADQVRLVDGLKEDLAKLRGDLTAQMEHGYSEAAGRFHERMLDMGKRQDELEAAATGAGETGARVENNSNVARSARQQGKAHLGLGETVLFRPHDGSGPKGGWPAIVCSAMFPREGFPPVYALWVLEPRRQRWEENVKEGEGDGTFAVR
jgi:hypothetical protein